MMASIKVLNRKVTAIIEAIAVAALVIFEVCLILSLSGIALSFWER